MKAYADIPLIAFPPGREFGPGVASFLAEVSLAHGPILRRVVGSTAGRAVELVYLVGPEANRLVFHTQRDRFSHDLGWTPIVGESLGHGLLNMDPPEHTRHRKMMNPAFAGDYMASYLPVMGQVIAERTRGWPERRDVDLIEEARQIAFDVAAASLVSAATGTGVDRLRELFYEVLHGFDRDAETWDAYL